MVEGSGHMDAELRYLSVTACRATEQHLGQPQAQRLATKGLEFVSKRVISSYVS